MIQDFTSISHTAGWLGSPWLELLGYLGLLAAIYLPLPLLGGLRRWAPYLLMAFTAVTILAWVVMGKPYTPIGYITKAIEAALIILLFLKTRQS